MTNSKKKIWSAVLISALFGLTVVGWFGYQRYKDFFIPNVPYSIDDPYLHIPTGSNFDQVVSQLQQQGLIKEEQSFRLVAEQMKYIKPSMRAGRFKIQPGWNNKTLVQHLRHGEQEAVQVVLNNERLLEDVAEKVARFIEPDSAAIMQVLTDEAYQTELGYTQATLMSLFIPNTYHFFWNSTPRQFIERMVKEHEAFWSKNNRRAKADSLNMTPQEVYTLASIVERETNQNSEKTRMAGVYLNRLRIGMLLQADPTCVFATRDFAARRVLDYHKYFDSPYNTYMYKGLPPGPISMSSIASIDAVLNPEQHDYFYFCAKPDASGFHSFAKTLSQHNVNAVLYRESIKDRK